MTVAPDSTNVTTYFALSLLADGADATGLTISDIDLQYTRSGVAPTAKVDAVALAATDTAHTDNRAIEIDATNQPGLYRVDWPDAAFAAGVREVILSVKCANVKTQHLRVELDARVDSIPSAVADFDTTGVLFGDGIAQKILDILADTAVIGATGGGLTSLATQASVNTIDDFLDTEIADIRNRLPASLTGGKMESNIGTVTANAIAAAGIASDVGVEFAIALLDRLITTHTTPNTFGRELHLLFATLCNTNVRNDTTGVVVAKDNDGTTTLATYTPATDAGSTTRTRT